jgi:TolB protein
MAHDGSKPRALRRQVEADLMSERDVAWSPDGELVAFVAQQEGRAGLRIVRVADGSLVTATDGDWLDQSPSFSADGEHIAFASNRDDNQPDLYIMRVDGSALRRLTTHRAADWLPRWTTR